MAICLSSTGTGKMVRMGRKMDKTKWMPVLKENVLETATDFF